MNQKYIGNYTRKLSDVYNHYEYSTKKVCCKNCGNQFHIKRKYIDDVFDKDNPCPFC